MQTTRETVEVHCLLAHNLRLAPDPVHRIPLVFLLECLTFLRCLRTNSTGPPWWPPRPDDQERAMRSLRLASQHQCVWSLHQRFLGIPRLLVYLLASRTPCMMSLVHQALLYLQNVDIKASGPSPHLWKCLHKTTRWLSRGRVFLLPAATIPMPTALGRCWLHGTHLRIHLQWTLAPRRPSRDPHDLRLCAGSR
jgi:hypothetical protein